jgi:hypothetical protein
MEASRSDLFERLSAMSYDRRTEQQKSFSPGIIRQQGEPCSTCTTRRRPMAGKISIIPEELGLPHTVMSVNIRAGEQFKPEFLSISPNNRIPAIVVHAPAVNCEERSEAIHSSFSRWRGIASLRSQ